MRRERKGPLTGAWKRGLLTTSNPKAVKGEAYGWYTAVLHLAPHSLAGGVSVCTSSTAGCRLACLNKAGRGGVVAAGRRTNAIQQARVKRTRLYFSDPERFLAILAADILRQQRRATTHGLRFAVRLNGTSDLPGLPLLMSARFPDVVFYDYTKHPAPWKRARPNYSVTFSRSESNESACLDALAHGVNVAVVFSTRKGEPLPARWKGWPVMDGDVSDLRFLDAPRHVVGVRAKGPARRDTSGFVVAA